MRSADMTFGYLTHVAGVNVETVRDHQRIDQLEISAKSLQRYACFASERPDSTRFVRRTRARWTDCR